MSLLDQGGGASPPRSLEVLAETFVNEFVVPNTPYWESAGETPSFAFKSAAQHDLTRILIPKDHAGLGLCYSEAARIFETLASFNAGFAFSLWVSNNVANMIACHGTETQVWKYLYGLVEGDCIGAFCLTEPGAGSDAAAITSRATRTNDGWRLSGTKSWVTNGVRAALGVVFAQTQPERSAAGIAAFLVPLDRPGIKRSASEDLPGASAFGISELYFDDCLLSDDDVLLPAGTAFKIAKEVINQGRVFVAAACCGMLNKSLDTAIRYAAGRQAFGASVVRLQGVQWPLVEAATALEASRLLTQNATSALDRGEPAMAEAAHAKKFASNAAFDGISGCIQAMGAAGMKSEYPLARHLLAAKHMHFIDGTTEIQNVVIMRSLLDERGLSVE